MAQLVQLAGDTSANWAAWNGIPSNREVIYETDTHKWKVGDGTTSYNSLPYVAANVATSNTFNTSPLRDAVDGGFSMGTLSAAAVNVQQGSLTNFKAGNTTVSATTYTLLASDMSKIIWFTAATAVTLTIPSGLPSGFNCLIMQTGAGQVTWSASGTTLIMRAGFSKTAGIGSIMTIAPHPTTNTYVISGDGA